MAVALSVCVPVLLPAQTVNVGVKAGMESTEPIFVSAPFQGELYRSRLRPVVELGLPRGFAFEVSASHKRVRYYRQVVTILAPLETEQVTIDTAAHSWDIPVVAKKYMTVREALRVFGTAGFSLLRTNASTERKGSLLVFPPFRPGPFQFPTLTPIYETLPVSELASEWNKGLVVGGGLDFRVSRFHLQPEVRYTRWTTGTFTNPSGTVRSNQNQFELLLGLSFELSQFWQ
jgi:opacity protein-like surface antigen